MGHDYYLLTDVCKDEQHHNSLKAIYAIDKIQKAQKRVDLDKKQVVVK